MAILPCKNCGHTFFAHSAGWPKGCADCDKGPKCQNYEYAYADPPAPRKPAPNPETGGR